MSDAGAGPGGKVFIDTNILVSSVDESAGPKRDLSRNAIRQARISRAAVISTQVLQEFFVVLTKKVGADPFSAKAIVRDFANMEVVQVGPALIEDAIDCSILHQLSFWDALLIAAAERANCSVLWSEDLADGQTIRGVRVENPLR